MGRLLSGDLGLRVAIGVGIFGLFLANSSQAGVFNLPHFVAPGEFGVGVEPELTMSSGAGLGVNLRYIQGLSDLSNFTGILGTGGGDRQFRLGGAFTFDFFPDTEGQPGIGLALQGLFVRLPNTGSVELTGVPYIHKSLKSQDALLEPYFAVPLGITLSQGTYKTIINLSFGSFFHHSAHFSSIAELGVSLNNSYTYLSGGIVYYH
jgi:hypothetical protein